jgi:hypothetical protein
MIRAVVARRAALDAPHAHHNCLCATHAQNLWPAPRIDIPMDLRRELAALRRRVRMWHGRLSQLLAILSADRVKASPADAAAGIPLPRAVPQRFPIRSSVTATYATPRRSRPRQARGPV